MGSDVRVKVTREPLIRPNAAHQAVGRIAHFARAGAELHVLVLAFALPVDVFADEDLEDVD